MFNIGLIELILIIFVLLVVIKPQDIPKVSKYLGLFYRKINRYIFNLKHDLTNFDFEEKKIEKVKEKKQKRND
tara:strand:+ start:488 stop:706 length:219 start_codon:yes stop_codon:yes gene_type:complete